VSEPSQTWTILAVLNWTAQRFTEAGLGSPRLDAEVLLAHVLGYSRVQLYTRFDQPLERTELDAYRELIRRRLKGEPVAYLTGTKEFWSLAFKVDPRVLIPRPETELLVETALELTADLPAGVLADVGTGSGAIACALKKERPGWRVLATDVSGDALAVARENAARLGLDLELLEGDLEAPLAAHAPLDLLVSNPPYIDAAELATLQREVRDHEPRLALSPGTDGLAVIRRLVAAAAALLRPGAALALEIGTGQGAAVRALLAGAGFVEVAVRRDYAGHDRVATGRRPA
jgi:release factor glutamine methyltransferase